MKYTTGSMLGSLGNYEKICECAVSNGNMEQIDLKIDLEILVNEAKLTEKQQQVLQLYYIEQYTQDETADKLGITQQAVLDHLGKIKRKITKVLKVWEVKDGKILG